MLELVHVIVEVGGVGDHLVLVHLLGVHLGVDALAPVRAREAVGRGQLLAVDLVHEERLAAVYLGRAGMARLDEPSARMTRTPLMSALSA